MQRTQTCWKCAVMNCLTHEKLEKKQELQRRTFWMWKRVGRREFAKKKYHFFEGVEMMKLSFRWGKTTKILKHCVITYIFVHWPMEKKKTLQIPLIAQTRKLKNPLTATFGFRPGGLFYLFIDSLIHCICLCNSIYLSIYLSTHLSIHPSSNLAIHPSIQPSIHRYLNT